MIRFGHREWQEKVLERSRRGSKKSEEKEEYEHEKKSISILVARIESTILLLLPFIIAIFNGLALHYYSTTK